MANAYVEAETRRQEGEASPIGKIVATFLSAVLIIGVPAFFWLSLLELANYALSFGLAMSVRVTVATVLIGVLTLIWTMIMSIGRHGRA